MHLKRTIALFLALSIFASFSFSALAEEVESPDNIAQEQVAQYDKNLELLNALGIFNVNDADLSSEMSRGEFCEAAYKLYGFNSDEFSGTSAFEDVSQGTVGFGAVNNMYAMGIISASDDGRFYPERAVTGYEAIKIVCEMMGFKPMAQYYGGWINGYLAVANSYKLLAGVKSSYGGAMTKLDAAYILYNSLFAELPEIDTAQTYDESLTLLSKNFDVYYAKGQITANDCFAISGGNTAGEDNIILGSVEYKAGATNISEYVGYTAEIYYKKLKNSEEAEIIWFNADKDNTILVLDSEDITDFNHNTYKYTPKGSTTTKSVKISATADIIYNKSTVSFDKKYMIPTKGTVTLIDSHRSGEYDVVNILSYKNIVVDSVYTEDKVIAGKYDADPIDLGDEDTVIDIKDVYGQKFDVENLFEWDVLTYIESTAGGKKRFEATLVRDYICGTVTTISGNDKRNVVIDDTAAKISASYPMNDKYKIQSGSYGDFLLDKFGEIAAFVNSSSDVWQFGYAIKFITQKSMDERNIVIFSEKDKEVKEYPLKSSVKVDGKKISAVSDVMLGKVPEGGIFIRFKTDSEGKIGIIDTPEPDENGVSNDSLVKYASKVSSGNERRYNNNATLGFNIAVGSKTRVFVVPTDAKRYEYEMYALKDQSMFKNFSTAYSFNSLEAYKTSSDSMIADAVVFYYDYANGMKREVQNNIAVVADITETLNEDDEICDKVKLLERGNDIELFTDNGNYDLKVGDGIQYGRDYKGRITDVRKIWSYNTNVDSIVLGDDVARIPIGASYDETFRVQMGYVYANKSGLIAICAQKPTGELTSDQLELHSVSNFKIEVVESNGRDVIVRKGSADDILDYQTYGDLCSKIAIFTKNSDSRNITVFK